SRRSRCGGTPGIPGGRARPPGSRQSTRPPHGPCSGYSSPPQVSQVSPPQFHFMFTGDDLVRPLKSLRIPLDKGLLQLLEVLGGALERLEEDVDIDAPVLDLSGCGCKPEVD